MLTHSSLASWLLVPLLLTLGTAVPLPNATQPNTIQDHYIFLMKSDLSAEQWEAHQDWSSSLAGTKKWTYNSGQFRGYCGNFTQQTVQQLSASDDVEHVEPDVFVKASEFIAQANATWGLSRISHREQQQNADNIYTFDDSAGAGTISYIIDSGVNIAHHEFEGRATFGANFAGDGDDGDLAGHGTHVAGTIGSRAFGVAKKTDLVAVKVLNKDGVGGLGDVLAGLDWAVRDAKAKGKLRSAFANLSLDGPFSKATNAAVARAVSAGMFVGVAAGNDGKSASQFSPASAEAACTVGASDQSDRVAKFSNFGETVDIFGPGVQILSTWIGSPTATNVLSGTSMASPHIVGLAAYLSAMRGPTDPSQMCQSIKALSTNGTLQKIAATQGSPNLIAYNGNGS